MNPAVIEEVTRLSEDVSIFSELFANICAYIVHAGLGILAAIESMSTLF